MQKQKAKIPVCTTSPAHRIQNSMEVPKKIVFLAQATVSWHRARVSGLLFIFPLGTGEGEWGDLLAQYVILRLNLAGLWSPWLWSASQRS